MSDNKQNRLSVTIESNILENGVVINTEKAEGDGAIIVLGDENGALTTFLGSLDITDFVYAIRNISERAINAFGSEEFQSVLKAASPSE